MLISPNINCCQNSALCNSLTPGIEIVMLYTDLPVILRKFEECDIPPHQAPQHPRWMPKWWLQHRDSQRFLLGKSPIAAPHPVVLRCTSLVIVLLRVFLPFFAIQSYSFSMLQMSPGGISNCGASMGRTNEVLMTEKSLCTAFAHCKLQGPSVKTRCDPVENSGIK